MDMILRPILELTVIIPGILLAYLPVKTYLRQQPGRLAAWLLPLLAGICILGGVLDVFMEQSQKNAPVPVLWRYKEMQDTVLSGSECPWPLPAP